MIRSLAYSPDGKTVASGSHDNTLKVWDVATGKERFQGNHAGAVRSLAFSQDRKSTRLNSSHSQISYAVFCLKKKKKPCRVGEPLSQNSLRHGINLRFYEVLHPLQQLTMLSFLHQSRATE